MPTAVIGTPHPAPASAILETNLAALDDVAPHLTSWAAGPCAYDDGRWDFGGRLVALQSRRPGEDAERLLSEIVRDGYPSHLVVIGLGLGSILDAIERWPTPPRVLALEPEPALLAALMRRRDWSPWLTSGRLRIAAGPDYAHADDAWRAFGADNLPPVVAHPVLARERGGDVLKARLAFERMRFHTPLDPRIPANSQSMLHYAVLAMYEHCAATATAGILEIGAYVGGGTMAICRGIRQSGRPVPFWSIERGGSYPTHPHLPSVDISGDLEHNLRSAHLDRFVRLIQAESDAPAAVARLNAEIAASGLSMLSIDADGQVQRDFDLYLHRCRPGCVVFVDDYSSPYAAEKVAPTREAVDRMVAAGILRSDGVRGWGTWIGRVIQRPRQSP